MHNTNSSLDVHLSSLGAWAMNWHISGGQTLSWQKKQKVPIQWHWTGAEKESKDKETPLWHMCPIRHNAQQQN